MLLEIQKNKFETRTLELKAAKEGCPKRLSDSLSSFSNQDDGGIIVFGIDEKMIMMSAVYMMLMTFKNK